MGFNSPFAGWLRQGIYNFGRDVLSKNYLGSVETAIFKLLNFLSMSRT